VHEPPEPVVTEQAVPAPLVECVLQWLIIPEEEHVACPVAEQEALPSDPATEQCAANPNAEHDCVEVPPPSTPAEQRPPGPPFVA